MNRRTTLVLLFVAACCGVLTVQATQGQPPPMERVERRIREKYDQYTRWREYSVAVEPLERASTTPEMWKSIRRVDGPTLLTTPLWS